MKKTRYSVVLHICLLSFSTLFSCTNARQAMNQSRAEQVLLKKLTTRPTTGNMTRTYNKDPKKIICGAIGTVALLGNGVAAYSLSNISSEGSNEIALNSSNFTTISPYHFDSSTLGSFNATGWNSNSSIGAMLAYSANAPSSTTVPNGELKANKFNMNNSIISNSTSSYTETLGSVASTFNFA